MKQKKNEPQPLVPQKKPEEYQPPKLGLFILQGLIILFLSASPCASTICRSCTGPTTQSRRRTTAGETNTFLRPGGAYWT